MELVRCSKRVSWTFTSSAIDAWIKAGEDFILGRSGSRIRWTRKTE